SSSGEEAAVSVTCPKVATMECSREFRFLSGRSPQFYTGMGAVSARNRQDPPESVCNRHQPIDASRSFRHDGRVGDEPAGNEPAPLIRPLDLAGDEPVASLRKRGRVWYFSFIDQDGRPSERKGCPDKRVTEELARAAESEAAKIKAGLVD